MSYEMRISDWSSDVCSSDLLGGDADVAPTAGIVALGEAPRRRHRKAAVADLEIDRGVELRIVELHQHVVAGNPQMGGAEGDESGHVEAAHTDDIEPRAVGGEAELAGAVVRAGSLRLDRMSTRLNSSH